MDPRVAFAIGLGAGMVLATLVTVALVSYIVERLKDHGEEEEKREEGRKVEASEANDGGDSRGS